MVERTNGAARIAAARDATSTWRSPVLGGTMFLRADFKRQRFQPHFHEEYAIGIIDAGCQAFTYDRNRRLDMPQGSIAVIAPGIVHTGWPGTENGWRYRMLYPSAATVREAVHDVFGRAIDATIARPVIVDAELGAVLSRLHDSSGDAAADALEVETLFLGAIRVLFEHHMRAVPAMVESRNRSALDRVRDLIEDRHPAALRLAELGAVAGLSKFSLVRQFKAAYGLPPHAYHKQVRVRRAMQLILRGWSPSHAAFATGFADQAHMTRTFKSIVGVTPGVLARGRSSLPAA